MNTQLDQDLVLAKTSYLPEDAITCTFNLVIRWSCCEMGAKQCKYGCTFITKRKLIKTVLTSLNHATKLYGITMDKKMEKLWSTSIANFILSNFYYERAFHAPTKNQIFDINCIPVQIIDTMIQNFHSKKMDEDLYNAFIESN